MPSPSSPGHPLDGWIKAVSLGGTHAGLNATLLPSPQDPARMLMIWRSAPSHNVWQGSEMRLAVSHDRGSSFTDERTIFLDPDWDTRNFAAGEMAGGRLGILCSRFRLTPKGQVEMHAPVFIFSDDGGGTWDSRAVPNPAREGGHANFHGDILPWPGDAGGADAGGFAAFSYSTPHKVIDGLYTRDNGESWEWRKDLCASDPDFAPHLTESWTVRLGDMRKWAMLVRPVASGQAANAALFFSDDMVGWRGPFDSGLPLSGNAPAVIVEGDTVHLYTVSRRGAKRELAPGTLLGDAAERGNQMFHASVPLDALQREDSDLGQHGGWREVAPLPEAATGYLFPRRIDGRWFAAVNCAETPPIGSREPKHCMLALITPHAPVIVDHGAWRAAQPQENLLDNGGFTLWRRGEAFDIDGGEAPTADRWRVSAPSGDRVTVRRLNMRHPKGGMGDWFEKRCDALSGDGAHRTAQRLIDNPSCQGERVTLTVRIGALTGSRMPVMRLRQTFGRGGSEPVEIVLDGPGMLSEQPLFMSFTGAFPDLGDKRFGPGSALDVILEEASAGETAPYRFVYGDIALMRWPVAAPARPDGPGENAFRCARYLQRVEIGTVMGPGGTASVSASLSIPMASSPVLRIVASDGSETGSLVYDDGSRGTVQVDELGPHGCMVTLSGPPDAHARLSLLFDSDSALPEGIGFRPDYRGASAARGYLGNGNALWAGAETVVLDTALPVSEDLRHRGRTPTVDDALWQAVLDHLGDALPQDLLKERRAALSASRVKQDDSP